MRGKFEALRFAAGKRGGGLAEAEVAKTNLVEDAKFRDDFGDIHEEGQGFAHGHIENIMDIPAVVANVKNAALEALAAAFLADQLNVGQELHFNGDGAIALASFATSPGDIKGKMAGGVAAALGVGRTGEDVADGVEGFEVGGGIGARSAANRRLIHDDEVLNVLFALKAIAEFLDAAAAALRGECTIEDVVNERGFAGPADARHDGENSQRQHEVHILQIVQGRAAQTEKFPGGLAAIRGNGNAQFAIEIAPSDGLGVLQDFGVVAGEEQLAAEFARAGTQIEDAIGGLNGVRVMLDDEHGVAEIAETFQDVDEALGVARVQADGGLVQNVKCTDKMRTQRRGQLDALRFPAGESGGQAVEGEVVEADFVEKLQAGANLFQNFIGDFGLRFGKAQLQKEPARFLYGELAKLRDGLAGDVHGAGFGAQARATAFGARGVPAETAQKDAHVEFVLFAFEPGEETLYAVVIVFGVTFEDQTALLGGELAPGNVCENAALARPFARFLHQDAVTRLGPRLNRAIIERF